MRRSTTYSGVSRRPIRWISAICAIPANHPRKPSPLLATRPPHAEAKGPPMTDPNPVAPKIAELGQKVRRIIAQGERQPANIDGPKTENQIRPEAAQPAQPFNRQRHTRNFIIFLQSLAIIALVAVAYGARKDLKAERETNAFLTSRPAPKGLSLSEVSQWRAQCGYLVGSHKSKAVDAFGVPTVDGSAVDFMMWLPSPKTGGRQISASLSHDWIVSVTV